jgi:stearoyl-CoA desaturase (delta-9 desaturase)
MSKARYGWNLTLPFLAVHVGAVAGVAVLGLSLRGALLAVGLYYVRMFGVTAGYHRYFAHRTYRTSRPVQFLLAFLAQTSMQKGALWWAAHHRGHHKHADTPADVHSFRDYGFFYAHVGWILSRDTEATEWERIPDLKRYPELVWLNEWHLVPGLLFALATFALGGWHGLVWGFFVSTTAVWHGTFFINSLAHCFGRRRYPTTDDSRNSLLLSLLTLGEGWHNNHHFYARSARQGFFWWELDITYYVLRAMSALGLVWDMQVPSEKVKAGELPPSIVAAASRRPRIPASASVSVPALAPLAQVAQAAERMADAVSSSAAQTSDAE